MFKIVTYQSPAGKRLSLTPRQERMIEASGFWPRDSIGQEYCSVHNGLHRGEPTYTDAEIRRWCETRELPISTAE